MKTIRSAAFAAITLALGTATLLTATSAQAQRWGRGYRGGWYDDPLGGFGSGSTLVNARDPREGKVDVNRFVAKTPLADELGHGPIAVETAQGDGPWIEPLVRRTYEAAIVDALVGAGYDTLHTQGPQAQTTRLTLTRLVLVPAPEKHGPISGEAAVAVSNHGTAYGIGINVDLSKPLTALVSTRLDARIIDKASGAVLWEGYATIATYDGDSKWSNDRIASRLAAALFDSFPQANAVVPLNDVDDRVPPPDDTAPDAADVPPAAADRAAADLPPPAATPATPPAPAADPSPAPPSTRP